MTMSVKTLIESNQPLGAMLESGAIERQEQRGQKMLNVYRLLPTDGPVAYDGGVILVRWGFELGAPLAADPLFREFKLPAGWEMRPTNHPCWSEIVDKGKNIRVSIFYKAAFYDRKAFYRIHARFRVSNYPSNDAPDDEEKNHEVVGYVLDKERPVQTFRESFTGHQYSADWKRADSMVQTRCMEWCDRNVPGWRQPGALWEDS